MAANPKSPFTPGNAGVQDPISHLEVKYPTYVVVDTEDGFTIDRDSNRQLFNKQTATVFAEKVNSARKPEYRTYQVFRLVKEEE
jgi:hypothetical protein